MSNSKPPDPHATRLRRMTLSSAPAAIMTLLLCEALMTGVGTRDAEGRAAQSWLVSGAVPVSSRTLRMAARISSSAIRCAWSMTTCRMLVDLAIPGKKSLIVMAG